MLSWRETESLSSRRCRFGVGEPLLGERESLDDLFCDSEPPERGLLEDKALWEGSAETSRDGDNLLEAKGSCGRKTSEQAKGFFAMWFVS